MTEQKACEIMEKTVVNGSPHVNTAEYLEALEISIDKLGVDYTREQLKNWILVNKYPFLMPKYWNRDSMTYEADKDYDYTWTELDEMPDGWRKAFGEMMCEEIKNALIECDGLDDYKIEQIKEKWGFLHWYSYPAYSEVEKIIDKYGTLSSNICIICGRPDVPMINTSWIMPMCKDCYCTPNEYYQKRMNSAAIEEFRKEHTTDWNKWYAEDNKMQDSYTIRRWSKEKDDTEEITYDISETANKIRSKWRAEHGE